MKVICISGKAQHGKDTSAKLIKMILEANGYKVLIAHYGDLVKYICKTFFDWNGEKDVYGRSLLQRIGTDVIRKQEPDYWVSFVADILKFFDGEWDYVLIPDSRFPNEVNYLKDRGFDVTHIRVIRQNFVNPLTPEQQNHPSETALDDVLPDHYINNCGTLDNLRDTISKLITQIYGCHQMSKEERGKIHSVFTEQVKRHSQKPEVSFEIINRLYPDAKKIELYARTERNGFDCWGNEVAGYKGA